MVCINITWTCLYISACFFQIIFADVTLTCLSCPTDSTSLPWFSNELKNLLISATCFGPCNCFLSFLLEALLHFSTFAPGPLHICNCWNHRGLCLSHFYCGFPCVTDFALPCSIRVSLGHRSSVAEWGRMFSGQDLFPFTRVAEFLLFKVQCVTAHQMLTMLAENCSLFSNVQPWFRMISDWVSSSAAACFSVILSASGVWRFLWEHEFRMWGSFACVQQVFSFLGHSCCWTLTSMQHSSLKSLVYFMYSVLYLRNIRHLTHPWFKASIEISTLSLFGLLCFHKFLAAGPRWRPRGAFCTTMLCLIVNS